MGARAGNKLTALGRSGKREEARNVPDAWTIGHSTWELEELVAVLHAHRIEQLADVRRYPASRRHPRFNREILEEYLRAYAIAYRWFEELGGRRPKTAARSPNRGIQQPGFRYYADYMQTPEFRRAFDELLEWMRNGRTTILCAEKLWWRCHRRLISDLLVSSGGTVHHIRDAETAEEHVLWELAVVTPEGVIYPPEQGELDLGRSPR